MSQMPAFNPHMLIGASTGVIETQLCPMQGRQLLMPASVLVETLASTDMEAVTDKPEWFLGTLSWREMTIPVVSFEGVNRETTVSQGAHYAVLNGIGGHRDMPYYAILIQGQPRSMKVKLAALEDLPENPAKGPLEFLQVRLAGELAMIPDLDALEAAVVSQL